MVGKQSKTTDEPREMGQLFLKIKLAESHHLSLNVKTKFMFISETCASYTCLLLLSQGSYKHK